MLNGCYEKFYLALSTFKHLRGGNRMFCMYQYYKILKGGTAY